jgi:hypothetical protein
MSADSETASYTSATAFSDNDRQPCPVRRRLHDTRSADDRLGRLRSPITNSGGVKPQCAEANRRVGTTVATANLSQGTPENCPPSYQPGDTGTTTPTRRTGAAIRTAHQQKRVQPDSAVQPLRPRTPPDLPLPASARRTPEYGTHLYAIRRRPAGSPASVGHEQSPCYQPHGCHLRPATQRSAARQSSGSSRHANRGRSGRRGRLANSHPATSTRDPPPYSSSATTATYVASCRSGAAVRFRPG